MKVKNYQIWMLMMQIYILNLDFANMMHLNRKAPLRCEASIW